LIGKVKELVEMHEEDERSLGEMVRTDSGNSSRFRKNSVSKSVKTGPKRTEKVENKYSDAFGENELNLVDKLRQQLLNAERTKNSSKSGSERIITTRKRIISVNKPKEKRTDVVSKPDDVSKMVLGIFDESTEKVDEIMEESAVETLDKKIDENSDVEQVESDISEKTLSEPGLSDAAAVELPESVVSLHASEVSLPETVKTTKPPKSRKTPQTDQPIISYQLGQYVMAKFGKVKFGARITEVYKPNSSPKKAKTSSRRRTSVADPYFSGKAFFDYPSYKVLFYDQVERDLVCWDLEAWWPGPGFNLDLLCDDKEMRVEAFKSYCRDEKERQRKEKREKKSE